MGMFLSMAGVVGRTQDQVMQSFTQFAQQAGGGLEPGMVDRDHANFCVLQEDHTNTAIFFPSGFLEWDEAAAFLSEDLQAPVFSFHVHDGDFGCIFFL